MVPLVTTGDYVGVSSGYRLSGEAIWPAQIHDCKAERVKVSCLLVPVQNGGHGGFNSPEVPARIKQHFDKQLISQELTVSADPILIKR